MGRFQLRVRRDIEFVIGVFAIAGVLALFGSEHGEIVGVVALFSVLPMGHLVVISLLRLFQVTPGRPAR